MENNKKLEILRRKKDFADLAKKGRRVSPTKWLVINFRINDTGKIRCGWTIPKQVGKAVIRNRLRRWCREILKNYLKTHDFTALDLNVFIRPTDASFYKRLSFIEFKEYFEKGLGSIRAQ